MRGVGWRRMGGRTWSSEDATLLKGRMQPLQQTGTRKSQAKALLPALCSQLHAARYVRVRVGRGTH